MLNKIKEYLILKLLQIIYFINNILLGNQYYNIQTFVCQGREVDTKHPKILKIQECGISSIFRVSGTEYIQTDEFINNNKSMQSKYKYVYSVMMIDYKIYHLLEKIIQDEGSFIEEKEISYFKKDFKPIIGLILNDTIDLTEMVTKNTGEYSNFIYTFQKENNIRVKDFIDFLFIMGKINKNDIQEKNNLLIVDEKDEQELNEDQTIVL